MRSIIILSFLFFALNSFSLANNNDPDELIHFSKRQEEALVVKVIASDMIVLEDGRRIKLIGIESAGDPPRKYV